MNPEVRTPKYVIELARKFRIEMTNAERQLWERIRNKQLGGYRFRNQHPVYRYILDFYCAKAKLAIELDGSVHRQRKEYDEYRDEFLNNVGIETMRIKDDDVETDIEAVLERITYRLTSRDTDKVIKNKTIY